MVKEIQDMKEFDDELAKANNLVVIDFTAVWCGPCKKIAPIFEALSTTYTDVIFLKVDVDCNEELVARYAVTAMPTFVFIKNCKEIDRMTGYDPTKLETKTKALK
ncbi:uncharacterized protein [Ambystoma mexicanum]|uniref:uncharacterized protein n=1 Tax=Ambystoma mexicanum TaxID=8296 RepID=UPI0037E76677